MAFTAESEWHSLLASTVHSEQLFVGTCIVSLTSWRGDVGMSCYEKEKGLYNDRKPHPYVLVYSYLSRSLYGHLDVKMYFCYCIVVVSLYNKQNNICER